MDEALRKVSQWMTPQELESLLEEEPRLGILLSRVLSRYKQIGYILESLKEVTADPAQLSHLSQLDQSIQVIHYFYQAALTQSVEKYQEIHEKFFLAAERLNAKIDGK